MSIADKLTTIAENTSKVYEAGKKAEYDTFWDIYQQNGNRDNYRNAFAGNGWNEHTLKPKYDITPKAAYMMFYNLDSNANIDLVKIEEECGIKFNFSQCTEFQYIFYSSGVVRIGEIDTRSASAFSQFAANNQTLHTIEKFIFKEDGSQTFYNVGWFTPPRLQNITIEGKIGNSLNATSSVLTKQSIISFINALSDTSTEKTFALSRTAVTNAFGSIDNEEWAALVASKPNWTISLV